MSKTTSALNEVESLLKGNEKFAMTELKNLVILNIRGARHVAQAVQKIIGISLPQKANTTTEYSGWTACWAAPDEWVLVSNDNVDAPSIISKLEKELAKTHFALTDQSSAYSVLRLTGSAVREVLQRGSTFDVHPREFQSGQCTQTGLEKMPVMLISRLNDEKISTIDLIVRRSFADYCTRWLDDAAIEFKSA